MLPFLITDAVRRGLAPAASFRMTKPLQNARKGFV